MKQKNKSFLKRLGVFKKALNLNDYIPLHQMYVYFKKYYGEDPLIPADADRLEKESKKKMGDALFSWLNGSGLQKTYQANKEAFDAWKIMPRILRDVSHIDTETRLFGTSLTVPFLTAPVGVIHAKVHQGAECAVAKAANTAGIGLSLSTVSTQSLEEVAKEHGSHTRFFQLYWGRDEGFVKRLLKRVEQAGFSAIVLTVDLNVLSWRPEELDLGKKTLYFDEPIGNSLSDPEFLHLKETFKDLFLLDEQRLKAQVTLQKASLNWDDLAWLKQHTHLPIVLKGIRTKEDANLALKHKIDGIIVSNHGGRSVDGELAGLDALPGVVDAVSDKIPVLFDGGIRTGSDILKALALGARAVLIGRPILHALSLAGQAGVEAYFFNLISDLRTTMALAGCRTIEEINASCVKHQQSIREENIVLHQKRVEDA